MSITATQVINAAKAEIRTSPYGRPNKYTKWYFGNTTAASWCGIFVKYVIEKICEDTELLKGCANFAYVPNIYNWAKKNGYIKYSGKKGDIIIFDWEVGNGKLDADHVGFFVKDNGNGTITTIEGNTSNASNGDGNCVQQRIRDKKWVGCYVRLPYKEVKSKKITKKYEGALPITTISTSKYTKSEAKLWQKFLNWAIAAGLKEDGVYGTMSYKATKEFQKLTGLTPDGIVGEKTLRTAAEYEMIQ